MVQQSILQPTLQADRQQKGTEGMSKSVTAIEAYHDKARAIAGFLAPRIGGKAWEGYTRAEQLEGRMISADTVSFNRYDNMSAQLMFGFISNSGVEELSRSKPEVLKKDVLETYSWFINIKEGTEYNETLEHEFSKTQTETSAWQRQWKVTAEASLGWAPAYATGGVKAEVKIGGEYGQDVTTTGTTSETTRDRVARNFTFKGPKKTQILAQRSLNKEQRTATIRASNEAKVYFNTEDSGWQFDTLDILVDQMKGLEPLHTEYTKFDSSSTLRQVVIDNPPTQEEIDYVAHKSDQTIEMVYKYDDVTSIDISEVST